MNAALPTKTWVLEHIAPRGEVLQLRPPPTVRLPTLKFMSSGLVMGDTGCNAYSASVQVRGETLKVGRTILQGDSNCPDAWLGLESDFLTLLREAHSLKWTDERLTVRAADGRFMTFKAAPGGKVKTPAVTQASASQPSLLGEWQLSRLTSQGQTVTVPPGSSVQFRKEGNAQNPARLELSGRAGCNTFFGKAHWEAGTPGRLSVPGLGMTMMLCEDMKAEEALANVLSQPVSVTFTTQGMTWQSKDGTAEFKRAAPRP